MSPLGNEIARRGKHKGGEGRGKGGKLGRLWRKKGEVASSESTVATGASRTHPHNQRMQVV
jgi:hypothetical protein